MDFEASSLKFMSDEFWLRCVSFHNDTTSVSIELADSEGNYIEGASELLNWLAKQKWIAHNAGYEQGCLYAVTGVLSTPYACTYGLLSQLANEGGDGQSWGLKRAAPELLGDHWRGWDDAIKDKKNMSKYPFEVLGTYNQIDSAATWGIYQLAEEAVDNNKDTWGKYFWNAHREDFISLLTLHTESYIEGLEVDLPYITNYIKDLEGEIEESTTSIFQHPKIKPFVDAYNKRILDEYDLVTKNYDKKYKKDGSISVNYQKRLDKREEVAKTQHFNLGSSKQLSYLLYDCLKCEVYKLTDNGAKSTDEESLSTIPVFGNMLLDNRSLHSQLRFLQTIIDNHDNEIIRVSCKLPGTITGRVSSGSIEEN